MNASYRIDDCIRLFRLVREKNRDAHWLGLSYQTAEMAQALTAAGIDKSDFTVCRANFDEMPRWLSCIDWGFVILNDGPFKRASMPTKLGEFLCSGVRPIHYGCNREVGAWVQRTGSGLSLESLEGDVLEEAARVIARNDRDESELRAARNTALGHFGLESSIRRYSELISKIAPAV